MLIMMEGVVTHRKTLQRARGTVDVGFAAGALARLYQAGAAKALPKIDIKKIDASPSLLCSSRGQAAAIRPLKASV